LAVRFTAFLAVRFTALRVVRFAAFFAGRRFAARFFAAMSLLRALRNGLHIARVAYG